MKGKSTPEELGEILQILRRELPNLGRRYGVTYLGAFGSYVHGKQSRGSDLDLLVEFSEAPSFFGFLDLEEHLSNLLGRKIDLVMKSALRPRLGRQILEEVVPV
jgi:predicted nucleotidyltransferase